MVWQSQPVCGCHWHILPPAPCSLIPTSHFPTHTSLTPHSPGTLSPSFPTFTDLFCSGHHQRLESKGSSRRGHEHAIWQ